MTTEAARAFGAALFIGGLILAAALLATRSSTGHESSAAGYRDDNRPVFCVEFGGAAQPESGLSEEDAVFAMDAGLELVAMAPYWPYGPDAEAPYAEYGCPMPAVLECPRGPVAAECSEVAESVEVPSPYKAFVYVLTQPDFDRVTGRSLGYYFGRRGPAEKSCGGNVCSEVTSYIYVTVDELRDPDMLDRALRPPLGLAEDTGVGWIATPTASEHDN